MATTRHKSAQIAFVPCSSPSLNAQSNPASCQILTNHGVAISRHLHQRRRRRRNVISSSLANPFAAQIPLYQESRFEDSVVILPGLGNCKQDYASLEQSLRTRGFQNVYILDIQRYDWARNAAGFLLADYWQGTLKPNQVLTWFFDRVDRLIQDVETKHAMSKIHLIGHSAGGWLARVYLGEVYNRSSVEERFESLITLGTPHFPPPKGFVDQTRGLLNYVNDRYPDTFHNMNYVCIGATSVQGSTKIFQGASLDELIAYWSYLPLAGNGNLLGDGIIPWDISCLPSATQVRLDSVKHSNLTDKDNWYGSEQNIDYWVHHLIGSVPMNSANTGIVEDAVSVVKPEI